MFFNYLVNCCTIAFVKKYFWDLSQALFCVFSGDPFREFNPDFILHCDSWDLSELFRSAAAMGPSALPTTLIGPLNFVGTIAMLIAIACPTEQIMKLLPLKPIFTPPPSNLFLTPIKKNGVQGCPLWQAFMKIGVQSWVNIVWTFFQTKVIKT